MELPQADVSKRLPQNSCLYARQTDSDYKLREAAPGDKVPLHSCHRDRLHLRAIQSHHCSSGIRGGFSPAVADSKQSYCFPR